MFHSYTCSELDLSKQLINPEEPDLVYDLYAVTVSFSYIFTVIFSKIKCKKARCGELHDQRKLYH